jgi:hypothetical protein
MSEQIESRESIIDEIESRAEYYGWLSGMYARLSMAACRSIPEALCALLLPAEWCEKSGRLRAHPEFGTIMESLAFAYDSRAEKLRSLASSDLYSKELCEKAIALYDDPLHGSLPDAWWEKHGKLKEGLLLIMRDADRIFDVRKPGDTCTSKRSRELYASRMVALFSPSVDRVSKQAARCARIEEVAPTRTDLTFKEAIDARLSKEDLVLPAPFANWIKSGLIERAMYDTLVGLSMFVHDCWSYEETLDNKETWSKGTEAVFLAALEYIGPHAAERGEFSLERERERREGKRAPDPFDGPTMSQRDLYVAALEGPEALVKAIHDLSKETDADPVKRLEQIAVCAKTLIANYRGDFRIFGKQYPDSVRST